tara:strand:+ start:294 stop:485 length:192 start_codon:yes stop_codon:yes gene_type:complete
MKNATQDASKSFDQKVIEIIEKQNDLIFSTRRRIFNLEKRENVLFVITIFLTLGLAISLVRGF